VYRISRDGRTSWKSICRKRRVSILSSFDLLGSFKVARNSLILVDSLRTFEGAVALVTGGASGIGRAIGESLARRGARVVLADLQVDLAKDIAARIKEHGGQATALALNVTEYSATSQLVQNAQASTRSSVYRRPYESRPRRPEFASAFCVRGPFEPRPSAANRGTARCCRHSLPKYSRS